MIDICTWRARIGLHRAGGVGSSGRTRAKVLLASSADGVEDWSLLLALSTMMDTHNSNLNMLIQRHAPKRGNRKKRKKLFRFRFS